MDSQRKYGEEMERKIIDYLNDKRLDQLDDKWKKHVLKIFPFASDDSVIYAKQFPDGSAKADMIIEINREEKYISIKTGKDPSIHHESFSSFQRFLRRLGVDDRTLKIIRFFHYGDSKRLGNYDSPLTAAELKEQYGPYLLEASKNLDTERIIKAVINRAILKGTEPKRIPIDFLYFGDLEHGKMLSTDELSEMVLANREHGKSAIHFGGLNYMPNSRRPGDKQRNYMRIKWPLLSFLYYCSDEDVEKMKIGTFKSKKEE